jgi:zinc/manganese transport system substrate-binding protein
MRKILTPIRIIAVCSLGVLVVACGSDDNASDTTEAVVPADTLEVTDTTTADTPASDTTPADGDLPTIVVTTNILGDIVTQTVGDLAEVEVIMPVGSDPHDFAPSAKQAEAMENADLLVTNGAGFEEGMIDIIEQVESSGTSVFEFADHVALLEFEGEHDHAEGEEHSHDEGEEHSQDEERAPSSTDGTEEVHDEEKEHSEGEEGHDHSGDDPHIWTDPSRMVSAVEAFGVELSKLDGIDAAAAETQVQAYVDELLALDAAMEETLAVVPPENRVLVTNHEVFGYFADRFDFEVVGAVIPSLTTSAEPSTAEVEALVELIEQEQISAIFADTSGSTQLAEAIAESAGNEVAVVVLYSESLGEPGSDADTYIGMMTTNATLIANALAPA